MKAESNARTVLLIVLILASAGAYLYLNIQHNHRDEQAITLSATQLEQQVVEQLEEVESKAVLPDAKLMKKLLEGGKRFLPAN